MSACSRPPTPSSFLHDSELPPHVVARTSITPSKQGPLWSVTPNAPAISVVTADTVSAAPLVSPQLSEKSAPSPVVDKCSNDMRPSPSCTAIADAQVSPSHAQLDEQPSPDNEFPSSHCSPSSMTSSPHWGVRTLKSN